MIDKMASTHRRKLLREAASGERVIASDIIARIALDEIEELDATINRFLLRHEQTPDPNKIVTTGKPYLKKAGEK